MAEKGIWKERKTCKEPGCDTKVQGGYDVCYPHGAYKKCTSCCEALEGYLIFIRYNPHAKSIDEKKRNKTLIDMIRQKIEEAETNERSVDDARSEFIFMFYPLKKHVHVETFGDGNVEKQEIKITDFYE